MEEKGAGPEGISQIYSKLCAKYLTYAGRNPDTWGKVTGSMKTWDEHAMMHLREITLAPGNFVPVTTDKGQTFLEKRLADGRGVRLNMDGTFKGFID